MLLYILKKKKKKKKGYKWELRKVKKELNYQKKKKKYNKLIKDKGGILAWPDATSFKKKCDV